MNTGFSTSEPDKKQQDFLSGNAISLMYEEPKKHIISCFDVSESGLVAVGSATYGNQYIYVYDATGKFQYGYALLCYVPIVCQSGRKGGTGGGIGKE
jgi:hypothetical protein